MTFPSAYATWHIVIAIVRLSSVAHASTTYQTLVGNGRGLAATAVMGSNSSYDGSYDDEDAGPPTMEGCLKLLADSVKTWGLSYNDRGFADKFYNLALNFSQTNECFGTGTSKQTVLRLYADLTWVLPSEKQWLPRFPQMDANVTTPVYFNTLEDLMAEPSPQNDVFVASDQDEQPLLYSGNLKSSQWAQPPWDQDNAVALQTFNPVGLIYPRTYMLLLYRRDVFDANGFSPPETWVELLAMATQLQGSNFTGAGDTGGYGICLDFEPLCKSHFYLMAIAASYIQYQGLPQGLWFEPSTMAPLVNNTAMVEAFRILSALYALSSPESNSSCTAWNSDFDQGRCAMSLEWDVNVRNMNRARTALRGKLGVAALPGSERVLDRTSGQLVGCSPSLCPYATFVAPASAIIDKPPPPSPPPPPPPPSLPSEPPASPPPDVPPASPSPPTSPQAPNTLRRRHLASAVVGSLLGGGASSRQRRQYGGGMTAARRLASWVHHEKQDNPITEDDDDRRLSHAGRRRAGRELATASAAPCDGWVHAGRDSSAEDCSRSHRGRALAAAPSSPGGSAARLVNKAPYSTLGDVTTMIGTKSSLAQQAEIIPFINSYNSPRTPWLENRQAVFASALSNVTAAGAAAPVWDAPPAAFNVSVQVSHNFDEVDMQQLYPALWAARWHPNPAADIATPGASLFRTAVDQAVYNVTQLRQDAGAVLPTLAYLYQLVIVSLNLTHNEFAPRYLATIGRSAATRPSAPTTAPALPAAAALEVKIAVPVIAGVLLSAVVIGLVLYRRRRRRTLLGKPTAPGCHEDTTLVCTDIQNSTLLWETLDSSVMDAAVSIHHDVLRRCMHKRAGYLSTIEGDSFIVAFHYAHHAVLFAVEAQLELVKAKWPLDLLNTEDCRPVWVSKRKATPDDRSSAGQVASFLSGRSSNSTLHSALSRLRSSMVTILQRPVFGSGCSGGSGKEDMHMWSATLGLRATPSYVGVKAQPAQEGGGSSNTQESSTVAWGSETAQQGPHTKEDAAAAAAAAAAVAASGQDPPCGPLQRDDSAAAALQAANGGSGACCSSAALEQLPSSQDELMPYGPRLGLMAVQEVGSPSETFNRFGSMDSVGVLSQERVSSMRRSLNNLNGFSGASCATVHESERSELSDSSALMSESNVQGPTRGSDNGGGCGGSEDSSMQVTRRSASDGNVQTSVLIQMSSLEAPPESALVGPTHSGGSGGGGTTSSLAGQPRTAGHRVAGRRPYRHQYRSRTRRAISDIDDDMADSIMFAEQTVLPSRRCQASAARVWPKAITTKGSRLSAGGSVGGAVIATAKAAVGGAPAPPPAPVWQESCRAELLKGPTTWQELMRDGVEVEHDGLRRGSDTGNLGGSGRGDRTLVYAGLRVRMGLFSGISSEDCIVFNRASGNVQYSGDALEAAKAMCTAAVGGMVLLAGETYCRLQPERILQSAVVVYAGDFLLDETGQKQWVVYQAAPLSLPQRMALAEPLRCKKCLQLGTPSAPVGFITVAFMYIIGAAALLVDMPEEGRRALDLCHEVVIKELVRWGGYLVEGVDGLVLATFSSSANAAHWGLACHEKMLQQTWSSELLTHECCEEVFVVDSSLQRRVLLLGPRLKVGLDVGDPTPGLNSSGRMSYRGRVLNRASRIACKASAGSVLCSGAAWTDIQTTQHSLDNEAWRLSAQSLGTFSLKGLLQAQELFACGYHQTHGAAEALRKAATTEA